MLAEHPAAVQHVGLDGAPAATPARSFRVVVGVLRHPAHPQWRLRQDGGEHLGTVVEEGALPVLGHGVADDVREVGTCVVRGVGDAVPDEHLVVGYPDATAGASCGAAETCRLLDYEGAEPVSGGGEPCGHPGRPAAHDEDVEGGLRTVVGRWRVSGCGHGTSKRCRRGALTDFTDTGTCYSFGPGSRYGDAEKLARRAGFDTRRTCFIGRVC